MTLCWWYCVQNEEYFRGRDNVASLVAKPAVMTVDVLHFSCDDYDDYDYSSSRDLQVTSLCCTHSLSLMCFTRRNFLFTSLFLWNFHSSIAVSYDSGNNLCLSYVEPCCEYYNEDRTVVQLARRAFSVAAPFTWNSTCWHSTVRKHSNFQTPLENTYSNSLCPPVLHQAPLYLRT